MRWPMSKKASSGWKRGPGQIILPRLSVCQGGNTSCPLLTMNSSNCESHSVVKLKWSCWSRSSRKNSTWMVQRISRSSSCLLVKCDVCGLIYWMAVWFIQRIYLVLIFHIPAQWCDDFLLRREKWTGREGNRVTDWVLKKGGERNRQQEKTNQDHICISHLWYMINSDKVDHLICDWTPNPDVCFPFSGERESLRLCKTQRDADQGQHGGSEGADPRPPLRTVPAL